jgi:hypothetical protein
MTTLTTAPATLFSVAAINHPALACTHYWDACVKDVDPCLLATLLRNAELAPLAAAYHSGGASAVLEAASGSNHGVFNQCWALAMTVLYGPTGTHETQMEHPAVIAAKARAEARLRSILRV